MSNRPEKKEEEIDDDCHVTTWNDCHDAWTEYLESVNIEVVIECFMKNDYDSDYPKSMVVGIAKAIKSKLLSGL